MDLSIQDMMNFQRTLYEAHKDSWDPLAPEFGKDSLLYMIEEVGEVIAVLKKKGSAAIVNDPVVRQAFLEEMADVLEVLFAICEAKGYSIEELMQVS